MNDYTKFMFDLHDFDEEAMARKKAAEEAPPPPSFSEEQLEQAKAEAFQKGRVQGIDEERQKLHQQALNTVMQLKPELQALLQNEHQRSQRFVDDTIALILESLTQGFPHFFEESFMQMMHDFVRDHVHAHTKTPLITIFVHPDVKDIIAEHVTTLQQELHHDGRVDVRSDPNTALGACRIAWPNGGATWSPHSLHEEILDTYRRYLDPDYVRVAQPPLDQSPVSDEQEELEKAMDEPKEAPEEHPNAAGETPVEPPKEENAFAQTHIEEQSPQEKPQPEPTPELQQPTPEPAPATEPAAEQPAIEPQKSGFTQNLSELEGDPVNPGQGQKPKDILDDIDLHAHLDKDVAPQNEKDKPHSPPIHEKDSDPKDE
jgi:flagellar assembly protein FliH